MGGGGGADWEIKERNYSPSLFFCSHSSPSHSHSLCKTLFMNTAKGSFPLQIFRYTDLNNITTLILFMTVIGTLNNEKIVIYSEQGKNVTLILFQGN